MVEVELTASVTSKRSTGAGNSADAKWQSKISEWPLPGRFAFFVFTVLCEASCDDFFPGLEYHVEEQGLLLKYTVAGTVNQFSLAAHELLRKGNPHDCCKIHRKIHAKLTKLGYTMAGEKTSNSSTYYLK